MVEPWIVVPAVAGSSPVGHPIRQAAGLTDLDLIREPRPTKLRLSSPQSLPSPRPQEPFAPIAEFIDQEFQHFRPGIAIGVPG